MILTRIFAPPLLLLSLFFTPSLMSQNTSDPDSKPTGNISIADYSTRPMESFPRNSRGLLKQEIWGIIEAVAAADPHSFEAQALPYRTICKAYFANYANWTPPEPPPIPEGRLRNLSDAPKEPRFPLTEKVWPSRPGEASVCLWEDDKLAAMSLSIDDNCAPDIPYWQELSKKYEGLNLTWNLVSSNIDGAADEKSAARSGTWEDWKQLLKEGGHIASHSVTHLGDPVLADGWPGPDWEAAESKRQIDAHLPGHKSKIFVYPGTGVRAFGILGAYYPDSTWRPSIVKYYAGARGAGENAINQANMIDYFNIRSTTRSVPHLLGSNDPKYASQNLNNLLNPDPNSPYHHLYRGWASVFIHDIDRGKDFNTKPFTVAYGKILEFYNQHRNDLWTGFLDDVALYGQERDTATLTTNESTDTNIVFTLTTKMDPVVFDYPLTVKVRLPDSWKAATAKQNDADLPVQITFHDGAPYALIKVVPDRGQVRLVPTAVK